MRAMVFNGESPQLQAVTLPDPQPAPGQLGLRIKACGVCRTDLHVLDGDLPWPGHAVIPGHEIVAIVESLGAGVTGFAIGDRIGVPWLGFSCGHCAWCRSGRENLCPEAGFTGYTLPGGYAERVVADSRFCFHLPPQYSDADAAPLLCAGLIGYRALRMAGDARRIGLYGFGAAAHLIAQVAIAQGREVYAFTRPGDSSAQALALALGASWAGDSAQSPPHLLDAAIIFAPVGDLVPLALRQVEKGGTVVCAGIHMSDIPAFPYALLWGERQLRSVANLTRVDGEEFFRFVAAHTLRIQATVYPLAEANTAIAALRAGQMVGAAVLKP